MTQEHTPLSSGLNGPSTIDDLVALLSEMYPGLRAGVDFVCVHVLDGVTPPDIHAWTGGAAGIPWPDTDTILTAWFSRKKGAPQ